MVSFLTSSFVPYSEDLGKKTPLINENGFAENLRKYWTAPAKFLVVAADPDDTDVNEQISHQMQTTFSDAGFPIEGIKILDHRNSENASELLEWSDIIFLSGGHGPTENKFINEINLRDLLTGYEGIFIGLSAGSVNAAFDTVQVPELFGEADDPDFISHRPGLGITPINIIPHAQYYKTVTLNGKSFYDDILIPRSRGEKIYFIDDGSYFIVNGAITEFFGTGEIIEDGSVRKISTIIEPDVFDALMAQGYGAAFYLDEQSGLIDIKHISPFLEKNGISPVNISNFHDLVCAVSERIIVDDEKQAAIASSKMDIVSDELERYGSYSRTFHYLTNGFRNSADLRIRRAGKCLFGTIFSNTESIDRDWMTDTFSRTGFIKAAMEFLEKAENPSEYSLCYTNIKGFKTINDIFGQSSGDMVIFYEKDYINEIFAPKFLCRLENDHFVFLAKRAQMTDENFQKLSELSYIEKYKKYSYTIQCSFVDIESSDVNIPDLIDRARIAEKSIRDDSKSNWKKADDEMRQNYIRSGKMLSELNDAVKDGEFMAYYQPIVDSYTGNVVTAESLIRWDYHHKGMISPGQFVPLFESKGKIAILDHFMLKSVADFQSRRLLDKKTSVPVSVNLSRIDFFDTLLIDDIGNIISTSNFPPSLIKLEVTESAYANIEDRAMSFLHNMQSLGVKVLLDDYGSGMSSLSTLEDFAFDTVKLDMGFIRKIGKSRAAESIIKSTINLAHDVGSDVIAEGVETDEQLEFLKDAGCEMIQGYYFYKPLPEEDFAAVINKDTWD